MTAKKILRIITAAIAISVVGTVIGMIADYRLFRWVYEIEPTNVWRSMDSPPGVMFYIDYLVINLIFVIVYALLRKGVPGKSLVVKGLVYGLCVFAVGQLYGMVMTYMFMTVAWQAVLYWTISGLILTPIFGVITATIYGRD